MKLAGVGRVRKPRYSLGDRVRVKDLPWIEGRITHMRYRDFGDGTGYWVYHLHKGKHWNENSLRKLPVRKKKR